MPLHLAFLFLNMKNIYLETIEAIENDIDVRVDILKRTLIVNKEVVIGNGCFDGNLGLPEMPIKKHYK